MNRRILLVIFSLAYFSFQTNAQDSFYYIARLRNNRTKQTISNANIINLNNKKGTTSNRSGIFIIQASNKDYLKITYVGYNDIYTTVNILNTDTIDVFLSEKTYQLEEVEIKPWTKEEFKYQFVNKEPPPDTAKLMQLRFSVSKEELIWLTPVSFHNYKTSKERQEIKLTTIKKWETKDNLYKQIVKDLTHYQDDEYIAFLLFCHFSKEYILRTREFYITEDVKKKYMEFEKIKVKQTKN